MARPELRAAMTEAGSWAETTEHGRVGYGVASAVVDAILSSDAVLAALPEYEQVGWYRLGCLFVMDNDPTEAAEDEADRTLAPVYIAREPSNG